MHAFADAVDRLSTACAVAASVLLALAVLVVTWMIGWRAAGNSAYWEIECSVYLMVAATFLGSPYCLKTGGHVAVDLLTEFLPHRIGRWMGVVTGTIGLVVCVFMAWLGWKLALKAFVTGETMPSTWRPATWPLYASMPIGLGLTALQYVADLYRLVGNVRAARKAEAPL